jgi:predicted SprT family Zn-dependent metalloprotease
MLEQAQIDLIEEKTQDIINKAEEMFNVDLGYVEIDFSMKGRIAGKAEWKVVHGKGFVNGHWIGPTAHSLKLRYNQEAFAQDWDGQFNDTIPHEVAHLVCAVNPLLGNNHDSGWRSVDIALGGTGETYHKLQLTPGRKTKRFIYTASCGTEINLSHVLHTRVQNGQNRTVRSTGGKINNTCPYRMVYKT